MERPPHGQGEPLKELDLLKRGKDQKLWREVVANVLKDMTYKKRKKRQKVLLRRITVNLYVDYSRFMRFGQMPFFLVYCTFGPLDERN